MSTPSSSASGNMMPQSTTSRVPSYSYAIMFIPNSPKPPSGMALSLAFRDEILVLLKLFSCYYIFASPRLRASAGPMVSRADGLCGESCSQLSSGVKRGSSVLTKDPPPDRRVQNSSLAQFRGMSSLFSRDLLRFADSCCNLQAIG